MSLLKDHGSYFQQIEPAFLPQQLWCYMNSIWLDPENPFLQIEFGSHATIKLAVKYLLSEAEFQWMNFL